MEDLSLGLDFIAALLTLLYLAKLLLPESLKLGMSLEAPLSVHFAKRSLIEQRICRRHLPERA